MVIGCLRPVGTSVACLLKMGEWVARNPSAASYACVVHPPQAEGFALAIAKTSLIGHIDEAVATITSNVPKI
jgi:hypothetical protein